MLNHVLVKYYITVIILLAIVGNTLDITWQAHADNVKLIIVYDCQGKQPFRAVNTWDIEPNDSHAEVRRVPTPIGQQCWITAQIMRGYDGWDGDPQKLHLAEWQILTHTER